MANEQQLAVLRQGSVSWNAWREENPDLRVDLSGANLRESDLREANLADVDLSEADLSRSRLIKAYLFGADLRGAFLSKALLCGANLVETFLAGAFLVEADLTSGRPRSPRRVGPLWFMRPRRAACFDAVKHLVLCRIERRLAAASRQMTSVSQCGSGEPVPPCRTGAGALPRRRRTEPGGG